MRVVGKCCGHLNYNSYFAQRNTNEWWIKTPSVLLFADKGKIHYHHPSLLHKLQKASKLYQLHICEEMVKH